MVIWFRTGGERGWREVFHTVKVERTYKPRVPKKSNLVSHSMIAIVIVLIATLTALLVVVLFASKTSSVQLAHAQSVQSIQFAYPSVRFHEYADVRAQSKRDSFSHIIPGITKYSYTSEREYMTHYARCYYAVTMRKGGWDCLRHYEIIASGCVPYFMNIDELPEGIMTTFPKALLRRAMRLPGVPTESDVRHAISTAGALHIDFSIFPVEEYLELRAQMLTHFEARCLTRSLTRQLGLAPRAHVAVFSLIVSGQQDYQRDLIVISLLENNCTVTTNFDIGFLFDDFPQAKTISLYGRGMTYTRELPASLRELHTKVDSGARKVPEAVDTCIFTTKSNSPIPSIDRYNIAPPTRVIEVDGNDGVGKVLKHRRSAARFVRELYRPSRAPETLPRPV